MDFKSPGVSVAVELGSIERKNHQPRCEHPAPTRLVNQTTNILLGTPAFRVCMGYRGLSVDNVTVLARDEGFFFRKTFTVVVVVVLAARQACDGPQDVRCRERTLNAWRDELAELIPQEHRQHVRGMSGGGALADWATSPVLKDRKSHRPYPGISPTHLPSISLP